jgi:hypothetical protein
MKSIFLMLIYTATFMTMFFLLSAIALLWCDNYHDIVANPNWFMVYSIFIGWWVAMFPTTEYYNHHRSYFKEYL